MRKIDKVMGNKKNAYGITGGEFFVTAFGKEAMAQLDQSSLEQLTSPEGRFGGICWDLFEKENPDWTAEDLESHNWAGGGFYSLPTAEFCERGNILFVTEDQAAVMDKYSFWAVCSDLMNPDLKQYYCKPSMFDVLVVVPNADVKRLAAEYAAEDDSDGAEELAG